MAGYIILHICTIHNNPMMYGSWDMKCGRKNFLSFWTIFCPFTSLLLKTWKSKFWKNEIKKTQLQITSFYTSVPKIMIICYTVAEIRCMTDFYFFFQIFIFHFGLFFALLTQWKNTWKYYHFTHWTKNYNHII